MNKQNMEQAADALTKAVEYLEDAQRQLAGDNGAKWQTRYKTLVIATSKAKWVGKLVEKDLKALEEG